MIKYVGHKNIDLKKWDDCIEKSTNLVYPLSWYLNCVAPNWNAFILENNNIYEAVFPICYQKKIGISYIYQPFFTQQLGYFSIQPNQEEFNEFLELIHKKFKHIITNLAIENTPFSITINEEIKKENTNCLLAIDKDYTIIKSNYNSNRKRDLKKASKNNLTCFESKDIDLLITIFKEFKGKFINELKSSHYNTIYNIFKEGEKRNQAKILFVKNENEEIQAGGLFVYTTTQIIFLFGCATSNGRTNGAMTYFCLLYTSPSPRD